MRELVRRIRSETDLTMSIDDLNQLLRLLKFPRMDQSPPRENITYSGIASLLSDHFARLDFKPYYLFSACAYRMLTYRIAHQDTAEFEADMLDMYKLVRQLEVSYVERGLLLKLTQYVDMASRARGGDDDNDTQPVVIGQHCLALVSYINELFAKQEGETTEALQMLNKSFINFLNRSKMVSVELASNRDYRVVLG
jgi:hypothetical protein